MSRDDPLLRVRLPEELKATIQARAAESRRSVNAQIVRMLEWVVSDAAGFAAFEDQSEVRSKEAADRLLRMSASRADPLEDRVTALEAEVAALKAARQET